MNILGVVQDHNDVQIFLSLRSLFAARAKPGRASIDNVDI